MKPSPPRPISEHRLARLTVWLIALLAWCALGLVSARRRAPSIAKLRGGVRAIIILRTAELATPFKRRRPAHRAAPSGFCFKRRRATLRRAAGAWLRRRLITRGSFVTQVKHLLLALRCWRKLAAQLAHRRRLGLSRLISITPTRPPAAPLICLAAPAPCVADTS